MNRMKHKLSCHLLLVLACTTTLSIAQAKSIASQDVTAYAAADAAISTAALVCSGNCDADADLDTDTMYGGIKQEYVVEGCKVTIYNDGPVKMVDENTDEPCDGPIPADHVFAKVSRSYKQNGCTVTEYESGDAVKDCDQPKKPKK